MHDDIHYVGFDNKSAARRMAEFVLSKGHRHIAMISGITHYNDRAADRVAGVREAFAAAGLDVEELEIVEAAYSLEAGGEALSRIAGQGNLHQQRSFAETMFWQLAQS